MEIIREQRGPIALWVAIYQGNRVGQIGIYLDGTNVGRISDYEVLPEHREFGIGTNLLLKALADVKAKGLEVISVCAIRPETTAFNLYEQAGFIPISKRVFVVGETVDLGLKLK